IRRGYTMKVCDRGTKKWISLMLPEHVELLKESFAHYEEKPRLDEQQMMEIDRKLKYSLLENVDLTMTYYDNGHYDTIHGRLAKIDQWRGYIMLLNENGSTVSLSNIIDVQLN